MVEDVLEGDFHALDVLNSLQHVHMQETPKRNNKRHTVEETTSAYLPGSGLHGAEAGAAGILQSRLPVRLVRLTGSPTGGSSSDAAVHTGSQESVLVGAAAVLLDAGGALELVQPAVLGLTQGDALLAQVAVPLGGGHLRRKLT